MAPTVSLLDALPGAAATPRVVIADDFPLMREAFASSLAAEGDVEVVGTAADGVEALERTREARPDVLVLDLRMPRMSGEMVLECLRTAAPSTRVLVVTGYDDRDAIAGAAAAGAAGILTKRATRRELVDAVLAVHRGERVLCESLVAHVAEPRPDAEVRARFTDSELEVLCLVADGETDLQISRTLGVSPRTVQNHLGRIREKTGVARRTELARWAGEHLA